MIKDKTLKQAESVMRHIADIRFGLRNLKFIHNQLGLSAGSFSALDKELWDLQLKLQKYCCATGGRRFSNRRKAVFRCITVTPIWFSTSRS